VGSEFSAVSALSEQSAHSAESTQPAHSARSVRSPLPPLDLSPSKAQVPRRSLRSVSDPLQKALVILHQIAFIGQLPLDSLPGDGDEAQHLRERRQIVDLYQRWLFGDSHNAQFLKRDVTKLMQRSREPVPAFEAPFSYEQLHACITDVCAACGYEAERSPSQSGGPEDDGWRQKLM